MVLFKQWKCFALIYPFCLGLLGKGRKQGELKEKFPSLGQWHYIGISTLDRLP